MGNVLDSPAGSKSGNDARGRVSGQDGAEDSLVPAFPCESFPGAIGRYLVAVADSIQAPRELVGIFILGAVSAALRGRWEIVIQRGYIEPCNLYFAGVLPPGSRKSAVASEVARELVAREAHRIDRWRETVKSLGEGQERPDRPERILTSDVTAERLAQLLEENAGSIAMLDAEGGGILVGLGQYKRSANNNDIDVYLKAHSGDPLLIDRKKGAEVIIVERPLLTLALAIQPQVCRRLWSQDDYVGRGLLDRFLWTQPTPLFGARSYRDPVAIPEDLRETWTATLRGLLEETGDRRLVELEPGARELWVQEAEAIEEAQQPGGPLAHVTGAASKLPGNIARMALVLHAAGGQGAKTCIGSETMAGAVELGRFFRASLIHVLSEAGRSNEFDPVIAADGVAGWMERKGHTETTVRDVCRANAGGIKRSVDARAAFQVLERQSRAMLDGDRLLRSWA